MICYRDMTFCSARCVHPTCERRLTPAVHAAARKWWGEAGAPIMQQDFSPKCPDYTPAPADE